MKSINDDLFGKFEKNEIENLEAITIRGGNAAVETDGWSLANSVGENIHCNSDSSVNGEMVAGYDCTCSNTNTGEVGPC